MVRNCLSCDAMPLAGFGTSPVTMERNCQDFAYFMFLRLAVKRIFWMVCLNSLFI